MFFDFGNALTNWGIADLGIAGFEGKEGVGRWCCASLFTDGTKETCGTGGGLGGCSSCVVENSLGVSHDLRPREGVVERDAEVMCCCCCCRSGDAGRDAREMRDLRGFGRVMPRNVWSFLRVGVRFLEEVVSAVAVVLTSVVVVVVAV
jgi:hypothetical protein